MFAWLGKWGLPIATMILAIVTVWVAVESKRFRLAQFSARISTYVHESMLELIDGSFIIVSEEEESVPEKYARGHEKAFKWVGYLNVANLGNGAAYEVNIRFPKDLYENLDHRPVYAGTVNPYDDFNIPYFVASSKEEAQKREDSQAIIRFVNHGQIRYFSCGDGNPGKLNLALRPALFAFHPFSKYYRNEAREQAKSRNAWNSSNYDAEDLAVRNSFRKLEKPM